MKNKELLLKDLCARLPYGVKVQSYNEEGIETIESFEILESHCANEVKIEFDPSKFEIVKRDDGYYVVKKQPQYPNTYEECCKVLGYNQVMPKDHILGYNGSLLSSFQQLLICRDAYWKIAGKKIGLGKPWKPSASDEGKTHSLYYNRYMDSFGKCGGLFESNAILDFPTKEMRDAFLENFKDLIEECKEFL